MCDILLNSCSWASPTCEKFRCSVLATGWKQVFEWSPRPHKGIRRNTLSPGGLNRPQMCRSFLTVADLSRLCSTSYFRISYCAFFQRLLFLGVWNCNPRMPRSYQPRGMPLLNWTVTRTTWNTSSQSRRKTSVLRQPSVTCLVTLPSMPHWMRCTRILSTRLPSARADGGMTEWNAGVGSRGPSQWRRCSWVSHWLPCIGLYMKVCCVYQCTCQLVENITTLQLGESLVTLH